MRSWTASWRRLPNLGQPRHDHAVVAREVAGRTVLLAFGGNFGASFGEGRPQKWDLWRLDWAAPTSWVGPLSIEGSDGVEPRGGFGGAMVGRGGGESDARFMIATGYGEASGGHLRACVSLTLGADGAPMAWRDEGEADGVEARSGATLTALRDGGAVLCGGYGETSGGALDAVHYAVANDAPSSAGYAWRELVAGGSGAAAAPEPRCAHAAAASGDDALLVFGGYGATSGPLSDLWELRVDRARAHFEWALVETTGDVPSPRSGHSFVELEQHAGHFALYGGVGVNGIGCSDVFVLDAARRTWQRVADVEGEAPAPRYNHRACAVPRGASAAEGGRDASTLAVLGGFTCDTGDAIGRVVGETFSLELSSA
jgi:hypothetical protein